MNRFVLVASSNPVKIRAAERSFETVFPNESFIIEGVPVSSGVPDQPIGIDQTLEGARNRVKNLRQIKPDADFFVGMEGGITNLEKGLFAFAWMYVEGNKGEQGKAMTGFFELPKIVKEHIENGLELGLAMDQVFSRKNSKQKGGAVGLLTDGLIGRTAYYTHAMILAMIPLKNKEYFK